MDDDIHKKIVVDENNKPVEVIISYDEMERIARIIGKAHEPTTSETLNSTSGILEL